MGVRWAVGRGDGDDKVTVVRKKWKKFKVSLAFVV